MRFGLVRVLFSGELLLTRYTAAILAQTQTYNIEAARRDLGYEPVVSVAQGVERTLAEAEALWNRDAGLADKVGKP